MKILDNVQKISEEVGDDEQIGVRIKNLAVKAMFKGIGSEEWAKYMSIFADNADQLKFLNTDDPTLDEWDKDSIAYLVSNAICGGASTGKLKENLDSRFGDRVANNNSDPLFKKTTP
jgi:hypothetical protein